MLTYFKPQAVPVIGALFFALMLGGCGRNEDKQSAGQKVDSAIAKVDEKADEAKREIKEDAHEAKAAAEHAMNSAKQATGDAVQVAATAVADSAITAAIKTKLAADADLKAMDINVQTNSGHVALNGKVPTNASRERAKQLAAAVKGVVAVDDKLTVMR